MNLSFREWFDRTVRGLPEHKIGQEDKKAEIDPFKEDESSQDYFNRLTLCQGCQRIVDPTNHQCEGLQPRFYLEDLVDWDEAPDWTNWAAQDANGVIWWYADKPVLGKNDYWGSGPYCPTRWYKYSVAIAVNRDRPIPRPKENSFYLENLVDFTQLPEWTNYVAQDDNGILLAFERRPVKRISECFYGAWDEGGRFYLLRQADCLAIDQDKPLKLEKEVKFKPVYND